MIVGASQNLSSILLLGLGIHLGLLETYIRHSQMNPSTQYTPIEMPNAFANLTAESIYNNTCSIHYHQHYHEHHHYHSQTYSDFLWNMAPIAGDYLKIPVDIFIEELPKLFYKNWYKNFFMAGKEYAGAAFGVMGLNVVGNILFKPGKAFFSFIQNTFIGNTTPEPTEPTPSHDALLGLLSDKFANLNKEGKHLSFMMSEHGVLIQDKEIIALFQQYQQNIIAKMKPVEVSEKTSQTPTSLLSV